MDAQKWLEEFTEAVFNISNSYEFVKVSTQVIDALYSAEKNLAQIKNKLDSLRVPLVNQNKSVSLDKIDLLAREDAEYCKNLEEFQELERQYNVLKRAQEVLKQFKDVYVSEIRSS